MTPPGGVRVKKVKDAVLGSSLLGPFCYPITLGGLPAMCGPAVLSLSRSWSGGLPENVSVFTDDGAWCLFFGTILF